MNEEDRLTLAEMRCLFKVVDQCRDLWVDPRAWRRQFLSGAVQLTRARTGYLIRCRGNSRPEKRMEMLASFGSSHEPASDEVLRAIEEPTIKNEQRLNQCGEVAYCFSSNSAAAGTGDPQTYHFVVSVRLVQREPAEHDCLVLGRNRADRPFRQRHVEIARLLHGEIVAILGSRLATEDQRSVVGLPMRCEATLRYLLSGLSEKEIAVISHRSINTIHEHVTTIYRHFDVSSRGELLAYFIRRRPLPGASGASQHLLSNRARRPSCLMS